MRKTGNYVALWWQKQNHQASLVVSAVQLGSSRKVYLSGSVFTRRAEGLQVSEKAQNSRRSLVSVRPSKPEHQLPFAFEL